MLIYIEFLFNSIKDYGRIINGNLFNEYIVSLK